MRCIPATFQPPSTQTSPGKEVKPMDECANCGNVYEVKHIKKGEDYNDFGYRYCPFCGAMFDIFIIPKEPKAPSEGTHQL
jgi:hypothetical protein